jgi:hypothetical protein
MAASSQKHIQINKANTMMIIVIAISSVVVVFSLVASKALLSQRAYQSRVIEKKEKARDQLEANLEATEKLIVAYKSFVGTSTNVLGGNPNGTGDKDGDNAKIILDALPSRYDFPALATSIEKIFTQNSVTLESITGQDDELSQAQNKSSNSPQPVDIPFEVTIKSSYENIQNMTKVLERSIRPIHIHMLTFSGNEGDLNLTIKAKTYYQPERNLEIKKEVVK